MERGVSLIRFLSLGQTLKGVQSKPTSCISLCKVFTYFFTSIHSFVKEILLAYSTNIGATAFGASLYHIRPHAGFYGIGFEQVGGSLPSAAAAFVYDFVHTCSNIVWVAKIGKNLRNRMMANGCILYYYSTTPWLER